MPPTYIYTNDYTQSTKTYVFNYTYSHMIYVLNKHLAVDGNVMIHTLLSSTGLKDQVTGKKQYWMLTNNTLIYLNKNIALN